MLQKRQSIKTYARETFWIMIVYVGYVGFMGNLALVELLIWPVMTFGLAAFGFKQEVVQDFIKSKKTNRTELDIET